MNAIIKEMGVHLLFDDRLLGKENMTLRGETY